MFDEPEEEKPQRPIDPQTRAREKFDEFRMHAELAAVFEGKRKFDAAILDDLPLDLAREIQRSVAKLEKSREAETPVVSPDQAGLARSVLRMPVDRTLSTNDYHIARRPGETLIVRWLAGEEVDSFYERLQAHFDVALSQFREEERQALGWRQEEQTLAYLDALDKLDAKMADRYLRDPIKAHGVFVLSTQTADEIDIVFLCDYVMSVPPAEVVGENSAPPEEPTEQDRAWFFKLFSLRGVVENVERMCFFAFLQKTEEAW
jgi:hypothetical protein